MSKLAVKFGIIGGLIVTILMFATTPIWKDNMDFDTGEVLGYISMIAALSTIFFGIKSYRDTQLNGVISFGKAFQTGLLITLVASVIYVAGWMLYSTLVYPDFADQYMEFTINKMRESGESPEVVEQKIEDMKQFTEIYKNPFVQIAVTFLEIFPVGLLVSLICAAILRKQPQAVTS